MQILLVGEGDSITADTPATLATSYFERFTSGSGAGVTGANLAQPGSTLADVIARLPLTEEVFAGAESDSLLVYSLLIGANDLHLYPGTSDMDAAEAYATTIAGHLGNVRQAASRLGHSVKLMVGTILPRSTDIGSRVPHAAFNTRRRLANTRVRAWVGDRIDACADFGADPVFGVNRAPGDPSLYYDGVHPTDKAMIGMESIYRAAMKGLGVPRP